MSYFDSNNHNAKVFQNTHLGETNTLQHFDKITVPSINHFVIKSEESNLYVTNQASQSQKSKKEEIGSNVQTCINSELHSTLSDSIVSKCGFNSSELSTAGKATAINKTSVRQQWPSRIQLNSFQNWRHGALEDNLANNLDNDIVSCAPVVSSGSQYFANMPKTQPEVSSENTISQKEIFKLHGIEKADSEIVISDCDEDADVTKEAQTSTESCKVKSRPSRTMALSDLSEDTSASIDKLTSFYLKPLNPKRIGHALQNTTID